MANHTLSKIAADSMKCVREIATDAPVCDEDDIHTGMNLATSRHA